MVKGNSISFEIDNIIPIPNESAPVYEKEIIKEALLNNSFLKEIAKSISM